MTDLSFSNSWLTRRHRLRPAYLVFVFLAVTVVCIGVGVAADDSVVGKPLVINESGTFKDLGVWLYRTSGGRFGFGPASVGTNEILLMPSPSPEPGGAVVGVEIIRHPFNTLGYPLHIALVEKVFASSFQISVDADNNHEIWSYDYGDPVTSEKPSHLTGGTRPAFKSWGPFHADAVPLAEAPEKEVPAAFDFAKAVLTSISNLPDAQKNLANYGVLFIDDGSTVWVELGPRFAASEAPHLGCQTQLGRDMVVGYDKKQPNDIKAGKFLQCF